MNEQNNPQSNEPVQTSKHVLVTIIVIAITAIIVGGSVYIWQNTIVKNTEQNLENQISLLNDKIDKMEKEKLSLVNNLEQVNNQITGSNDDISDISKSITIENPNVKIYFPNNYSVEKNQERNRRGTYVSYDFRRTGEYTPPHLYELQFFSEKSITNFTSDCREGTDSICFMGDYPTLERYFGQKEAFSDRQNYTENYTSGYTKEFRLEKFNNRNFFVSFIADPNGSGFEYSTFIDDVKIDIWINVENRDQKTDSDELFKEIIIEEL